MQCGEGLLYLSAGKNGCDGRKVSGRIFFNAPKSFTAARRSELFINWGGYITSYIEKARGIYIPKDNGALFGSPKKQIELNSCTSN